MFTPQFPLPSVMKHDFSKVPHADIQRSSFRRSHSYKTTLNENLIIPIYVDEALPGDTFNVRLSSVCRINTLLFPIMDNLHMDFFFFFVPNRLLWENWQKFMGEQIDPGDSISYTVPVIDCPSGGWTEESLADYFGIPIGIDNIEVNALHFRAYNLIYNEWFRDQNLIDSVTVDKDDGPDAPADYVLLKRCKRHDYFTSCLPWPQKNVGGAIELPLGTSAPVIGNNMAVGFTDGNSPTLTGLFHDASVSFTSRGSKYGQTLPDTTAPSGASNTTNAALGITTDGDYSGMVAGLSSATAATINSLREAFQLQRLLERDARGGTRYTEIIQSHFGVTSPDQRLQRPEYLGGGSRMINVEPVPVTSKVGTPHYHGDLGGIGYQNQSGVGFTKSFVEHGVILGLVNIRADLTYQKGLNRMWKRQTRYDYYFPTLAHLGEQEVLNQEIYLKDGTTDTDADGTVDNEEVFGYQERWAEYRYYPSLVTGALNSNAATPLDSWHLSQDFGVTAPELNQSFIEVNVPMDRILVVTTESSFRFDGYFDIICTRPMPLYSVPGLIDHF